MWLKQAGFKPRSNSGSTPSGNGAGLGSSSSQNAQVTAVGGGGTGATPTPANNVNGNGGRRRSSDVPFSRLEALKRTSLDQKHASFMEQVPGNSSVFGRVFDDIFRGKKGPR